ncbi:MAG: PHP domain-containing protein [Pseudomonadota bacterium]
MFDLIDLHTHSDCSDGVLPPAELVALAALRKVTVLALTDHDSTDGCEAALTACRTHGIGHVTGAELTASWRGQEIHIVGLGFDPHHPGLRLHLADLLERRRQRIAAIGEKLRNDPALAGRDPAAGLLDGKAVPTRTHLARALVAMELADNVSEAFDRYLSRKRPAHVPQEWPDIASTVAAIATAGGHAVLAHAHRYKLSNGALRELCAAFRAAGGEGLEVSLPGLAPPVATRLASLARSYDLAGSIGSDFHVPGLPWRPLGRFAKLPAEVVPLLARLTPQ